MISVGFPGTVASLRQQWGRAGRRGNGLAVLVATEDALDQFFMREPDKLLGRRVEAAILDHANPRVLAGHVRAAAYEAPLDDGDAAIARRRGARARRARDPELRADAGRLRLGRHATTRRRASRSARPTPTRSRSSTRRPARCSASSSASRAYSTVHEGAVYLHLGESYLVRELDLTTLHAVVEPFDGDWYTQAKKETMTDDRRAAARRAAARARARLRRDRGDRAGRRLRAQDDRAAQERIELVPLELPPTTFETEAIWFLPEPHQLAGLDAMPKLLGTLHAAEHALIALLPLWAMCDRWDIGGLSTNIHPQTGRPTVFVYDGHAGGVGITERGFEQFEGWVARHGRAARAAARARDGCPSCVQSPKCGNLNEMLDKAGALTLLCSAACRFRARPFVVETTHDRRRRHVKYALLIYGDERRVGRRCSEDEQQAIYGEYVGDLRELPGTFGGAQLQPADDGDDGARRRRRDADDRRPVRRDEGGARRLLPVRGRQPRRRRSRSRRAIPAARIGGAVEVRPAGGALTLLEQVFRDEWGRVLAALIGFLGDFDLAEEAAQEAFAIAAERWPRDGMPANPGAWLVDDGAQPRDRPDPARAHARREDAAARRRRSRSRTTMDDDGLPRRAARADLHVLPPGARARRAGRADAAHARRPDDRRDRARVPRPGADDGAAARAREAEDHGGRHPVPRAARRTCCPTGSPPCSRSST